MKQVTVTYTKPSDKVFFLNSALTPEQSESLASLSEYKLSNLSIKGYQRLLTGDTLTMKYAVDTEEDYNIFLTYIQSNFSYIIDENAYNAANGITRSVTVQDIV